MCWTARNWELCRDPRYLDAEPLDPRNGFAMLRHRGLTSNFHKYVLEGRGSASRVGVLWQKILDRHAVEFLRDVATVRGELVVLSVCLPLSIVRRKIRE